MPTDRSDCMTRSGHGCSRRAAHVCAALTIAVVLAGCASVGEPGADRRSYVGVFTGDFVDGLPLYRLPPITVVGRRDSVVPD